MLKTLNSKHLHMHIEETGRDADGRHGFSSITDSWGDDTGRQAFTGMIAHEIKFLYYKTGHTMYRFTADDGSEVFRRFGPTDEGYESIEIVTCDDAGCMAEYRGATVYDQFAQAAGY